MKTTRYHYTSIRKAKIKNSEISNSGRDGEKLIHSYIASRNIKLYSYLGKVWQFLIKYTIIIKLEIILLGIYSREMKTYVHT